MHVMNRELIPGR